MIAYIVSFAVAYVLIPHFCTIATRLRFVDSPDGIVKLQSKPVPYLGGVAVYSGFLCGLALVVPFENKIFLLVAGVTLLLLLGLFDDLFQLKAYQKFIGQLVVALCFLKAGFYLKQHVFHNIWNLFLSLLWILTVINAFNLIDVMDGLATLVAIWATITLLIIAFYLKHFLVATILISFLGALSAFFLFNRPPARMYLGDAGSLFIGGFLATVPFLYDWGTFNAYGYLTAPIILGIPLLECFSLIVIRISKGKSFYLASPDHFSCYLQGNGWGKWGILYYISVMSAFLGLVSVLFSLGLISLSLTSILGVLFLSVWIVFLSHKF